MSSLSTIRLISRQSVLRFSSYSSYVSILISLLISLSYHILTIYRFKATSLNLARAYASKCKFIILFTLNS